jgi:hypothetical protein
LPVYSFGHDVCHFSSDKNLPLVFDVPSFRSDRVPMRVSRLLQLTELSVSDAWL